MAGFAEVLCTVKNVISAVSAEIALSVFKSIITADKVVLAMKEVRHVIYERFKETAQERLTNTPIEHAIAERIL
ncbi:hypothetical protein [uncultured Brachyspira sp.]|uniref:hypothetical protein n=1 Tax=uncultured Brachyspira sp. TaxID=221953 RepID=UPI002600B055|nr:hypothetical protein [uncultured Brachyspira sp.]